MTPDVAVTAELTGFAAHPRQGVLLRAGSNFQVDIVMEVGALAETPEAVVGELREWVERVDRVGG